MIKQNPLKRRMLELETDLNERIRILQVERFAIYRRINELEAQISNSDLKIKILVSLLIIYGLWKLTFILIR